MAVDGITATYIAVNQFSVVGNQTVDFHGGRRVKAALTGGNVYSTISGSVFGAVTTVTLFDSELDNTLTTVWYGIGIGSVGSLPDHAHDSSEGSGGELTISGVGGDYLARDGSTPLTGDWNFGSQTISGTGDIWCNDLHTAGASLYIGDVQLTSAANVLDFGTNTVSGTGDMAAGRLGIGNVVDLAGQNSKFWVISEDVGWGAFYKYSDDTGGSAPSHYKARGTYASPAAVQASDVVGGYNAFAHDGTQHDQIGKLRHLVESISSGNVKSYIEFHVSDVSGVLQEMARINSTGMILGDGVDQQADYALHVLDSYAIISLDGDGSSALAGIAFDKQHNTQWLMYNDGANSDVFLLESDGVGMYSIAIGRTYGDIGIGYKGPNFPNSSTRLSIIADESGGVGTLNMYQHSDDSSGSAFSGYSSRGADQVNPTAVVADDVITGYNAWAHDGTVFDLVGKIRHRVESINLGDIASYIEFYTSSISGIAREVMRMHSTGDLELYEGALILANYGTIGVPGRIDVMTVSSGIVEFDGHIRATLSGAYDIGTSDYPFRDIYLTGGSVYLNAEKISSPSSGIVDFNNATLINVTISGGGTTEHSALNELDYASAGHTDFVSTNTTQTITGLKTFSQDVTMEADLTAVSGTFDYVEITDSVSEIQFTSASGVIGVAGDEDLLLLSAEQLTIQGTNASQIVFSTSSGTIGVSTQEDLLTLTSGIVYFDGHIRTTVSGAYDIGEAAYPFRDIYLTGGSVYLNAEKISSPSSGIIDFNNATIVNATISGGGISAVSEDPSPQLGGDLDTGAFTISGTGDVYCNDIFTSGGTVYIGDAQISSPSPGVLDFGGAEFQNFTGVGGGGSGAGAVVFVQKETVASGTASVNFDLPQTAQWFEVYVRARSGRSGDDTVVLTFNNDTGTNYDSTYFSVDALANVGGSSVDGVDLVYMRLGDIYGTDNPNRYAPLSFKVYNYTQEVETTVLGENWFDFDGTDDGIVRGNFGGSYTVSSGVTSMQIELYHDNFIDDTEIIVYGYGDTLASGTGTFLNLTDTPTTYSGSAGKSVVVNQTEDGLEFTTISGGGSSIWTQVGNDAYYTAGNVVVSGTTPRIYVKGGTNESAAINFQNDADLWSVGINTDDGFYIYNNANSLYLARMLPTGMFGINESSNTDITIGLTINQDTNNDNILDFKSSDVATGRTETDTFGSFQKVDDSAGGLAIKGYKDSTATNASAARLMGFLGENAQTTKSTSGRGIVDIYAAQLSAGSTANVVSGGNLFTVIGRTGGSWDTKWICDIDGETWQEGGFTTGAAKSYINDTSNADMTIGLTINQGANDDQIFALKSSDIAHGITGITETDTYFYAKKLNTDSGGATLVGLSEINLGLIFGGILTTDDTTKTTSSHGAIILDGAKKSGTGTTSIGTDGNIVAMKNNWSTRWILNAEGKTWQYAGADFGGNVMINAEGSGSGILQLKGGTTSKGGIINVFESDDSGGDLTLMADGTAIMKVGKDGTVFINETTNTGMTIGLTINQGANDNEALALKSSDVSHPVTGVAEADTYFMAKKQSATNGGVSLYGITDDDIQPFIIHGVFGTTDPLDPRGAVEVRGYKSDGGTGTTTLADAETIFNVRNNTLIGAAFYGNGSAYIAKDLDVIGDISCNDIYTASGTVYIGDEQISSTAPGVLDFGGAEITNTTSYQKGRQELIIEYATTSGIDILPGRIDIEDGSDEYALSVSGTLFKDSLSLSADTWYYVYAKPPAVGNVLSESEIELSTTEPGRDVTKRGYYHGSNTDWRCFSALYSDVNSEVKPFMQIGDEWKVTGSIINQDVAAFSSTSWTDATFTLPFGETYAIIDSRASYGDVYSHLRYKKKGVSGDVYTTIATVRVDNTRAYGEYHLPIDSDKKGEIKWSDAGTQLAYLNSEGFVLPDWIAPK